MHALSFLVGHTLALPFLVTFPLIDFLLTCTAFARQIPGSFPYALSTLLVPTLLYPEPHSSLSVHGVVTLYPYHILGW
jgi:hypothetical protein